ncbi:MAG TPA: FHA domain-containing protein [Myxococcota bacterium]|nr:FHA domain-containing protein [Myxococcota bacterium]HRY94751.1 FHA domain-containing protein [Myxococcota bacterium]HSA20828.1 FHA domain-containing protein [Myxococcota bacterium]
MEAWLVALAPEGSLAGLRREVPLGSAGALLGREDGLELALPDPSVSLRHARVAPAGPAGWTVEDLASRNGTRLNGRRLEPGQAVPLRPGDELELGSFRVRLWAGDPLALPDARATARALAGRLLAPPAAPGRLVVVDGPGRGDQAPLPDGAELSLGRAAGCGLRLPDPRVSRRHAAVLRRGARVRVRDLGSANGLRVAGHRVRGEAELGPGECFVLGGSRLRLELDAEPEPCLESALRPAPRAVAGRASALPWLLAAAACSAGLALWGG